MSLRGTNQLFEVGGACLLRPGISDVNLLRYRQGIIYFDAQISDGASNLCMPEQQLDSPEISRAPINQGSFGSSQRMRPKWPWIESDATNPLGNEARILTSCYAVFGAATACEQELPGFLLAAFR